MLKKVAIVVLLFAIGSGIYIYSIYKKIYLPNVSDPLTKSVIHIPTNSSYDDVFQIIQDSGIVMRPGSFDWVAKKMKYSDNPIKPGRYRIEPGWNNRTLVGHLRSGNQEPLKVIFNNVRTTDELFDVIGQQIEPSPSELKDYFQESKSVEEAGYNEELLMTLFIPNTYELYWNTSPEQLLRRMQKENKIFWEKDNRLTKIKKYDLSPDEVYTMASIVEKESIRNDEKPIIAGVYLNRIKRGMRLQADPTVVFAVGDFELKRVLYKHLEYPSPYNTYLNDGLPPGPICMPSIASLDAVINAKDHNYLYFCAKPGTDQKHAFAVDQAQHIRNANVFHRWLNSKGIR